MEEGLPEAQREKRGYEAIILEAGSGNRLAKYSGIAG